MREASDDQLENLIGAFAVTVAEHVYRATETATGRPQSDSAALMILATSLKGASQEALGSALSLTQSGTTRLVDRLTAAGLATRRPGLDDRTYAIVLTPKGRAAGRRALLVRERMIQGLTADLTPAGRDDLAHGLRTILSTLTTSRPEAFRICKMCDPVACGHDVGRCPVTQTASALAR